MRQEFKPIWLGGEPQALIEKAFRLKYAPRVTHIGMYAFELPWGEDMLVEHGSKDAATILAVLKKGKATEQTVKLISRLEETKCDYLFFTKGAGPGWGGITPAMCGNR